MTPIRRIVWIEVIYIDFKGHNIEKTFYYNGQRTVWEQEKEYADRLKKSGYHPVKISF